MEVQNKRANAPLSERGEGPGALPARGLHRITRDDWLLAGFALLEEEGARALTPARLAKRLKAPQLRFFWQFGTVEAFAGALITAWRGLALEGLGSAVFEPPAGRQKDPAAVFAELSRLCTDFAPGPGPDPGPEAGAQIPGTGNGAGEGALAADRASGPGLEAALRLWSREEPALRAAMAEVDQARLAHLTRLISGSGTGSQPAAERAAVFYAARLGFEQLYASVGVAGAAPMQALAAAIFGGRARLVTRARQAGGR